MPEALDLVTAATCFVLWGQTYGDKCFSFKGIVITIYTVPLGLHSMFRYLARLRNITLAFRLGIQADANHRSGGRTPSFSIFTS